LKDVIRISTAGSVDDGKSTLIGRLLYETKSLKADQLQHIEEKSILSNKGYIDFSLVTDGLLTERRQGITIDVSYIYLQTEFGRYIIADSPGHVEYTRNMVTGSSTADAAIILLDAQKGVSEQTIRHIRIASLLGIPQLVFAINKMDLIDYNQDEFDRIRKDILDLHQPINGIFQERHFIPISALHGDNIVHESTNFSWYEGRVLIDIIEDLKTFHSPSDDAVLNVQYVLRPKDEWGTVHRGYAGKIACGRFTTGMNVTVSPGGMHSSVKRIEHLGEPVEIVNTDENVTLYLNDHIDISRGSVIVSNPHSLIPTTRINATICWMERACLEIGGKFWIQHGVTRILCIVSEVEGKMNLLTGEIQDVKRLEMNDLGRVQFQLGQQLLVRPFAENKSLGSFILINYLTNNTAGVGFVL